MRKPPQRDRVLRALELAGDYGTCQGEWFGMGPDGRGSITRLAARINDLRARGHTIVEAGERNGFRVYRLIEKPVPLPVLEPDERLFAPPPVDAIRGEAA